MSGWASCFGGAVVVVTAVAQLQQPMCFDSGERRIERLVNERSASDDQVGRNLEVEWSCLVVAVCHGCGREGRRVENHRVGVIKTIEQRGVSRK